MKRMLERVLGEHFGTPTSVEILSSREGTYVSSWAQREIDVRLSDGTRLELIVKSFKPVSDAKPELLVNARRESRVYRGLLPALNGGTPKYFGVADGGSIVLERVDGTPLWQIGDFSKWLAAARWIGEAHSVFSQLEKRPDDLLKYDDRYYRAWPVRARANLPNDSLLTEIARDYGAVVDTLLALPTTIIHGEFHASNIIVRDDSGAVCVLDWETAAVAPGLMDLADLTSGKWDAEQRAALAEAYFAARQQPPAAANDLAACRVHRAVQWLGWSCGRGGDWNAPPHHANDWLDEARRAWRDFQESR